MGQKCLGTIRGWQWSEILSPVLFNLYVDELSKRLHACNSGCMSYVMYVDVVFSPSAALQERLKVCSAYGLE